MKFLSVNIENFGPVGKAHVNLDERGLVLIQGENETSTSSNSNGAGKSSIVEAISWCLYGKTAKDQTGDSVINRTVGKGCLVDVNLQDDDGSLYRIIRGRKHAKFKSKLHVEHSDPSGTKTVDLTKGTDKLTQALVEQIIGCPHDVFVGAVYAGQEKMPDLPGMTDKHLKLLIEEAAGITVLDRAYTIARDRAAQAKMSLSDKETDLSDAERAHDRAKERLQDAREEASRWVGERDARIIDHETSARTLIGDARAFKHDLDGLKTEEAIKSEQALLTNKMKTRDLEESKHSELVAAERRAQLAEATARSSAESEIETAKSLSTDLGRLKGEIGKPCKACGRAHDETSLSSAIAAKSEELSAAKSLAQQKLETYKQASRDAQSASQSASSFKDDMTDMSEALALSQALSDQLSNVKSVQGDYNSAVLRAKEATESIKKERAAINPHEKGILERKKAVETTGADLKAVTLEIKPLRSALHVAQDVVSVYAPKGVRAHVLDTVTPYLNDRTAHYLGALADGEFEAIWQTLSLKANGEMRENFSIQVSASDGGGSFNDLSGGEKRKVRIACALALQDLVATRASKSLDLFVADEIDAALDVAALERLMGVLDEKAKERGSVLIISHSDLRDWVSNCMTVTKKNGVSEVLAA